MLCDVIKAGEMIPTKKTIIPVLLSVSLIINLFVLAFGFKSITAARNENKTIIIDYAGNDIASYRSELQDFMINPTRENAEILNWIGINLKTNLSRLNDKWYISRDERRLIANLFLFQSDISSFYDGCLRGINNKDSKDYNKVAYFKEYVDNVFTSISEDFISSENQKYMRNTVEIINAIEEGHKSFKNKILNPSEK